MLIAFGVLTFGVRVAVQLRRTGSTGLIGLREGAGLVDWLSGILFIGGMAMGAGSPVLVLTDVLDPISGIDVGRLHAIGIALAAIGGLAVFGAQLGIGESYLLRTHGDSYRAYGARVGRFVPRVGLFR